MRTPQQNDNRREHGFTLVELLIAVVVLGIIAAVAIVGVGGLIDNGAKGACQASADAAKAATAVHFSNTGVYPATFAAMTGELDVPANVTINATTLVKGPAANPSWIVTMNNPGVNAIRYSCNP